MNLRLRRSVHRSIILLAANTLLKLIDFTNLGIGMNVLTKKAGIKQQNIFSSSYPAQASTNNSSASIHGFIRRFFAQIHPMPDLVPSINFLINQT
jgi:hypothetical protein